MALNPKHGSWLDLAESELGVLASQCLDRRIADKQILAHEVTAWQDHRNKHHAKADWQFMRCVDCTLMLKRMHALHAPFGRIGGGVGTRRYRRVRLRKRSAAR